ncbi:Glycosyltransferase involved in cell wall bisynthesis [Halogranum amylolyticum]|uniref:Glycosyltransferase involved in cell wall bisynthesis n=1 Tax=Halogranum amylolyticum TaxID=660520 RepID=A0A1H8SUA5_9EURY|nr:glycosyltransferase family 4 protein [Halogranum amylolyticum]SEO82066.1 Glycosyltransferase involved in cell wall bisynthesis [Halogranum amylolyticum]
MRVLQVTTRYPPHTGGVETHVAELAERLVARGHEVTVLTADARSADAPRRQRRNGVRVVRHRGVAPGGAFHVAPGVVRSVRDSDADVVHAHNYHSLPLLFAAVGDELGTNRRRGDGDRPLVATPHYHGASASDRRDRLLSLYRPLGGWALRRADAVVAVSDWERRALRRDFGVDARVIPNGLDVERFADATPADSERPYLLSVGRLETYKGVQHAIRTLTELPDYDLVVAGSGPDADELRRVAREAGVADRVEFLGYVADADLPGLYAGASAFVTLSGFEAYGMTVAEALAAGTPCVVREAGALVDWVERADVVSIADGDQTNPRTVADAVEAAVLLDAPSEPLPTWEDVVAETEGVYESVVASQ